MPLYLSLEKEILYHKILQTEKVAIELLLLRKHEGTCFLSLPKNKIVKENPTIKKGDNIILAFL